MGNIHSNGNQAGTLQLRSAAPPASSASTAAARSRASCSAPSTTPTSTFRAVDSAYPRQNAWILHAGDTWRVNDKLTLDYGLRWDYYSPSSREVRSLLVLRSGRRQSRRRRAARAPRLRRRRATARPATAPAIRRRIGTAASRRGSAPSTRSTTRRSLRSGWGIFYTQAFYPGWGGGISQDGFSNTAVVLEHARRHPAGVLPRSGAAAELRAAARSSAPTTGTARASCIARSTPTSGPYSHQWNITVDRELGAQPVAERRLRRQRGPPAAVEHRAAQRDRPEPTCRWATR